MGYQQNPYNQYSPGYGQGFRQTGSQAGNMWLRVAASVFDWFTTVFVGSLILFGLAANGGNPDSPLMSVGVFFIATIICLYFPISLTGLTLGKLIFGLRVVREDDTNAAPGLGAGLGRFLSYWFLTNALCGIGAVINLIMTAVDSPEHRSLHDRASRTRVISTRNSGNVTAIVLGCVALGLVLVIFLSAIAIPVFLNQRAKGVEAGMKADTNEVINALNTEAANGNAANIRLPLVLQPGASTPVGTTTVTTEPNNTVTVTTNGTANGLCIKVANPEARNTLYTNSVDRRFSYTPCDGSMDTISSGQQTVPGGVQTVPGSPAGGVTVTLPDGSTQVVPTN